MLASPVICPHCRTPLKSAKAPPPGLEILCPKCQTLFRVPEKPPVGRSSAIPVTAKPVSPRSAVTPVSAAPPQAVATMAAPAVPERRAKPSLVGMLGRLLLILLAAAAVVGGGGALAWWCLTPHETGVTVPTPVVKNDVPDNTSPVHIPDKPPEIKSVGKKRIYKPNPNPLHKLTAAEQETVNTMVQKGIDFLKKSQNADGTWPGKHGAEVAAMGGLTLLECGAQPTDPAVLKAASHVRGNLANMHENYGVSLYLLFLDRLEDPSDEERVRNLAARLVAAQLPQGSWTYKVPLIAGPDEDALWNVMKATQKTPYAQLSTLAPAKFGKLPAAAEKLALFKQPAKETKEFFEAGGDNSNTQFAMLALWAARRRGLPVDAALRIAVHRFLNTQRPEGAWPYDARYVQANNTPSMTCAGLLGLAIGYGLDSLPEQAPKDKIKAGLDVLAKEIARTNNLKDPTAVNAPQEIYFIWSIERVGMLFKAPEIGGQDWYRWGMRILQRKQKSDGAWAFEGGTGYSSAIDTNFALLFLRQANLAQDLSDKLEDFLLISALRPHAMFARDSGS